MNLNEIENAVRDLEYDELTSLFKFIEIKLDTYFDYLEYNEVVNDKR